MKIEEFKLLTTEDFVLNEDFRKLAKGETIDGISIDLLKTHFPEKSREISLAFCSMYIPDCRNRHLGNLFPPKTNQYRNLCFINHC